ncbi:MAG: hypothetical protein WCJ35_12870 [Planctomycetota bacterium]
MFGLPLLVLGIVNVSTTLCPGETVKEGKALVSPFMSFLGLTLCVPAVTLNIPTPREASWQLAQSLPELGVAKALPLERRKKTTG